MKKIFFCCLLMSCAVLLKAQNSPVPMRTSDPAPVVNAEKPTLPIRNGGGAMPAASMTRPTLPLRSGAAQGAAASNTKIDLPLHSGGGTNTTAAAKAEPLPLRTADGGGGGAQGQGTTNPLLNNIKANSALLHPSDQPAKQDSTQKH